MKKISNRDTAIYQMATGSNPPTLQEIGNKFGISRQRVSVIIKSVQASIGEQAKELDKTAYFPIKKHAFYTTANQSHTINCAPGETYSDQIRGIIDYFAKYYDRDLKHLVFQGTKFNILKGGVRISKEQNSIIESAPGKTYSQKMRYIIDFYYPY